MSEQGLDFQLVDLKMTQGVDTKTQNKLVVPGKFNSVSNMSFADEISMKKRNGMSLLSEVQSTSINTINDELVLTYGSRLSTVNSASPQIPLQNAVNTVVRGASTSIIKNGVSEPTNYTSNPPKFYNNYVGSLYSNLDTTGLDGSTINGTTYYGLDSINSAVSDKYLFTIAKGLTSSGIATRSVWSLKDITTNAIVAKGDFGAVTTYFSHQAAYIKSSDSFVACMFESTGSNLVVFSLSGSTFTLSAAVNMVANATSFIDMVASGAQSSSGNSDSAVIAGVITGDVNGRVKICKFNVVANVPTFVSLTSVFPEAQVPIGTALGVSVVMSGPSGQICVAALDGIGNTWARYYDNSVAAVTAAANISSTTGPVWVAGGRANIVMASSPTTNNVCLIYDYAHRRDAAFSSLLIRKTQITITAGAVSVTSADTPILQSRTSPSSPAAVAAGVIQSAQGPFIAAKPMVLRDIAAASGNVNTEDYIYLPMRSYENYVTTAGLNCIPGKTQNTIFYFDYGTGTPIGKSIPSMAGIGALNRIPLVNTNKVGPSFLIPILYRPILEFNIIPPDTFVSYVTLNSTSICLRLDSSFLTQHGLDSDVLKKALYYPSSSLTRYSNGASTENGFYLYPDGVAVVDQAAGNCSAGSHVVVATYVYTDSEGVVTESAPSDPTTITIAAGRLIRVTIPSLNFSSSTKAGKITVNVYMTTANGSVLYNTMSATKLLNDTFTGQMTWDIDISDTSLRAQRQLYTQPLVSGSRLPNDQPPPSSTSTVFQNRIFLDATEEPGAIYFSQQPDSFVGLEFSSLLKLNIPTEKGPIVALETLDDKLVIFCERGIYIIYGSGPDASGQNNQYSPAQLLPSDVGCVNGRSLVKTNDGIIFRSNKGMYMLSRDLSATDIGDDIQGFDNEIITSGCFMESRREVRFTTLSNKTLVYSHQYAQWSTYDYQMTPDNFGMYDSIWYPKLNTWVACADNGIVYEVEGQTFDYIGNRPTGTFEFAKISTSFETGWLALGKLEGYQRVKSLYMTMTSASNYVKSTVTMSFAFDDDPTIVYSTAIDLKSLVQSSNVIDIIHRLQRQKCKSVKIYFSDVPETVNDIGVNGIQAMLFEIGVKRGSNKINYSKKLK